MDEITCPNCNVDVDIEELRRNSLCCPTCGQDLSDSAELARWSERDQETGENGEDE